MRLSYAESKKRSAKGSSFKEDARALPLKEWLLYGVHPQKMKLMMMLKWKGQVGYLAQIPDVNQSGVTALFANKAIAGWWRYIR